MWRSFMRPGSAEELQQRARNQLYNNRFCSLDPSLCTGSLWDSMFLFLKQSESFEAALCASTALKARHVSTWQSHLGETSSDSTTEWKLCRHIGCSCSVLANNHSVWLNVWDPAGDGQSSLHRFSKEMWTNLLYQTHRHIKGVKRCCRRFALIIKTSYVT